MEPPSADAFQRPLISATKKSNPFASVLNVITLTSLPSQAALVLVAYLGTALLIYIPNPGSFSGTQTHPWVDALYFSVVTLTTVGYGDIVPATSATKLFCAFFGFLGLAVVFTFLNEAGKYILSKQEDLMRYEVEKITHHHLEAEDIDVPGSARERMVFRIALAGLFIFIQISFGMVLLCLVEGYTVIDAFYCCCITLTTVGYGDIGFVTFYGRLLGMIWLLSGTLVVGWAIGVVLEAQLEKKQTEMAAEQMNARMSLKDLEAADSDRDGLIGSLEFVVFKLVEMGKATRADVARLKKIFEGTDGNHDGYVGLEDITQEQIEKNQLQSDIFKAL